VGVGKSFYSNLGIVIDRRLTDKEGKSIMMLEILNKVIRGGY